MDIKNLAYLYNIDVLDFAIIEKALTLYYSQCSYLNKNNVERTLSKVRKILNCRR